MKFTRKDNLIIIGAGKISYSLVPALIEAGYIIKAIVSSKKERAQQLAHKLNIKEYSDNPETLRGKRGIFVLAVPDSQIITTAELLSTLKIIYPKSLFIHLSGSNDISLLKSLAQKKAQTASFHIMQTFPSRRRKNIKSSFTAIETKSKEASVYLFRLACDLGLKPFLIESKYKVIYHLAGVFASNFINAILFQSQQLFDKLGLREYSFNNIISPLYNSTIKNIRLTNPAIALSGPIERGDLDTIKKHIKELKQLPSNRENFLTVYLSLSLTLLEATIAKSGKLKSNHIAIKQLLLHELNKII